jgi:hypothetical protein
LKSWHFISTASWLWRHIDHMTIIDKQRIAAVRTLEARGYDFNDPANFEGDALHALLLSRALELVGCTEGSPEEAELEAIADAIEGYEAIRWPDGKAPGGKAELD